MKKSIWWIKRDFRLIDNEAFSKALTDSESVLPIFIFEPNLIAEPDYSPMHVWAWIEALKDLQKNLRKRNGDVLIATGEVCDVLNVLRQKWDFEAIYSHEETGNDWTFSRDKKVLQWCQKHKISWIEVPQNGVIRKLKSRDDRQPIIKQRLLESSPITIPKNLKFPKTFQSVCQQKKIPKVSDFFDLSDYPHIDWDQLQMVSESQAQKDLQSFLYKRGYGYSGGISSPNSAFTHGSRLSPHLAWGTLSLRNIFHETFKAMGYHKNGDPEKAKQWGKSLRAFTARLHWHDHFIQRLETASVIEFKALNPAYENIVYAPYPQKLKAWTYGQTGFPLIDACMRCLQATGFINFRMRAMVVSFAIYGLHLSWKTIHPHLAKIFLDYEPGIHLSQLQMQAGIVGINTIRVYSPTKQILDQDPDCIFIKKWIPELKNFTVAEIVNYEKIKLGTYPTPVVDFKQNIKQMKAQIFEIRKSNFGKAQSQKVLAKHGSRKKTPQAKKKKITDQKRLFEV